MAVYIKIPDLIQLALVPSQANFNVLRIALQAIVYQMNLSDINVLFKGDDATEMQNFVGDASKEELQQINVNFLYEADLEKDAEEDKRKKSSDDVIVVESGKIVEPLKKKLPLITQASFARLEAKVATLEAQTDTARNLEFPSDQVLLEVTRSSQDAEPIKEMLTTLNLYKRITGVEQGLDKLGSLVETMAKEFGEVKEIIDNCENELGDNFVDALKQIKNAANNSKKTQVEEPFRKRSFLFKELQLGDDTSPQQTKLLFISKNKPPKIDNENEESSTRKDTIKSLDDNDKLLKASKYFENETKRSTALKAIEYIGDKEISTTSSEFPIVEQIVNEHKSILKIIDYLHSEMGTLADYLDAIITKIESGSTPEILINKIKELQRNNKIGSDYEREMKKINERFKLEDRIGCLETQFANNSLQFRRQLVAFCERTNNLSVRLNDCEDGVSELLKSLNVIAKCKGPTGKKKKNTKLLNIINSVLTKYQKLQHELSYLKYIVKTELQINQQENLAVEECLRQLEILKKIKADRFEMDENLAIKADCDMLKQKVSVDEFQIVCNDLLSAVKEAMHKFESQEEIMKSILSEIHEIINLKCNMKDLEDLRSDLLAKFSEVHGQLIKMTAYKAARLAAGGKQRTGPMNCLSCDRKVYMGDDDVLSAVGVDELPPSTSIEPFISHQLNRIRKMLVRNPSHRKMFIFKEAMSRYRFKPDELNNEIYITGVKTRFCGGKHTTMTKPKLDCKKHSNTVTEMRLVEVED